MHRIYCTQFDSQFLTRGIAMLRSVRRFDACATLQVLALDGQCAQVLADLFRNGLNLITTETLAEQYPELPALREQRSTWAYYATQKPMGVMHALENAPPMSIVAFIDADTWFFADPTPLFAELGAASIGLSPHRYSTDLQHFAAAGEYNAGCILWRADAEGVRCTRDWTRDCLEWCGEQLDASGRYMNQGYLRNWPERYSGVHVLSHPGVNLAPWNVDNHMLAPDGAGIAVDGSPLIFFHFSGLVPSADGVWHSFHSHRHRQLPFLRESIYGPYLAQVEAERDLLRRAYGIEGTGNVRAELTIGPGVLSFRAATHGTQKPVEIVRQEDMDVELARHRRAIRVLVDAGMVEAALTMLRSCGPPLQGSRGEWEYYMAFCLQSLARQPETALRHYTAALEQGYEEFWVRFHRGQLLLKMGCHDDAVRDLQRALELRPFHEGLPDFLMWAQGT